jgi:hypothetical protein
VADTDGMKAFIARALVMGLCIYLTALAILLTYDHIFVVCNPLARGHC